MLDRLIAPVPLDRFYADYWERTPLHIPRDEPGHFDSLLRLSDIDAEIARPDARFPGVRATRADEDLPKEAFVRDDGRIDPVRLVQCFQDGATIIVNQAHRRFPALADLCRRLAAEVSSSFQTNLYLTPPGAQGFDVHYDDHDVIVLQIDGAKEWTIHDAAYPLPLQGEEFDPDEKVETNPVERFVVQAGDTVYIPRGVRHAAKALDEHIALHVTVGIMTRTWFEFVVEAIARRCFDDIALRRALPPGFAHPDFDPSAMARTFREHLEEIARSADFAASHAHFVDTFLRTRELPASGLLETAAAPVPVEADAPLRLRPGAIFQLLRENEGIVLRYGDRMVRFPERCGDALDVALSGAEFRPSGLPGPLDDAGHQVLARRLIREGLLEPIPPR